MHLLKHLLKLEVIAYFRPLYLFIMACHVLSVLYSRQVTQPLARQTQISFWYKETGRPDCVVDNGVTCVIILHSTCLDGDP